MTGPTAASVLSLKSAADQLAAALTEIGLPLHADDCPAEAGGVRITAAPDGSGLEVGWDVDESLADDDARTDQRADVLETMNLALGDLLTILGWDAHPWNDGEVQLIVGRRPLRAGARSRVFRD